MLHKERLLFNLDRPLLIFLIGSDLEKFVFLTLPLFMRNQTNWRCSYLFQIYEDYFLEFEGVGGVLRRGMRCVSWWVKRSRIFYVFKKKSYLLLMIMFLYLRWNTSWLFFSSFSWCIEWFVDYLWLFWGGGFVIFILRSRSFDSW